MWDDDATGILIVSPSRPPIFAFFFSITFSRETFGTDVRLVVVSVSPSREDPVEFISIRMDELVRVSKGKGEEVYLYSARVSDELSTGNCKGLLTKLRESPLRFLIDDKASCEQCSIEPILH